MSAVTWEGPRERTVITGRYGHVSFGVMGDVMLTSFAPEILPVHELVCFKLGVYNSPSSNLEQYSHTTLPAVRLG